MKRFWMIALVLGLVAGFGLATAFSAVNAQTDTPETPQGAGPWGQGMMSRHAGGMMSRGGMMGGYAQQDRVNGPMHEYMQEALAAEVGLTKESLTQLHDEGQTFWQIAEAQGFSTEETQQMLLAARSAALDKMVADSVITQEQADFMKTRMGGGMGAGDCQGGGRRGGMHGNWLPGQDS